MSRALIPIRFFRSNDGSAMETDIMQCKRPYLNDFYDIENTHNRYILILLLSRRTYSTLLGTKSYTLAVKGLILEDFMCDLDKYPFFLTHNAFFTVTVERQRRATLSSHGIFYMHGE